MKIPSDMAKGCIHVVNDGEIEILEYRKSTDVSIRFLETGYETVARTFNIRSKEVKDKLKPRTHGIGFVGDGDFSPSKNGRHSKAYTIWRGIFRRCYDPEFHKIQPTYSGCTVSKEWHNFQNFAKWFYENYPKDGKKYDIDKDIILDGNKVYSPDLCCFVTHQENSEKAWAKVRGFVSPEGELVKIYNLKKYCRENNLGYTGMLGVSNGKFKSYKGWIKSD